MVRVIMGVKGTGKTKQMIELINSAAKSEAGSVVCIEHGSKLTYDIHYQIRLVEAKEYAISSFDMLKGFISGLHASHPSRGRPAAAPIGGLYPQAGGCGGSPQARLPLA